MNSQNVLREVRRVLKKCPLAKGGRGGYQYCRSANRDHIRVVFRNHWRISIAVCLYGLSAWIESTKSRLISFHNAQSLSDFLSALVAFDFNNHQQGDNM